MRSWLLATTIGLAGCATAGVDPGGGGGGTDAPTGVVIDAPPLPDASVSIDASVDQCPSSATCAGAIVLGMVSGDTANQKLTASGYQAAWYRVRVTEDNDSPLGLTLRVGAKVTSSAAASFDVRVYLNAGSDTVECSTTTGTATTSGNVRQVRAEWGEGSIANGSDDGRHVSIEVRPLSTACAPDQPWQLEVEGNWL